MWIIAGPNGAGKSSFAGQLLADLGRPDLSKLNADERTFALRKRAPHAAQQDLILRAAREIDEEVEGHIRTGHSLVVETVLSSPKYRDDVEAAKALERYGRSHEQLVWFAPKADILMVFDNSAPDGRPVMIASRAAGKPLMHTHKGTNPAVDTALQAAFPVKPRRLRTIGH